MKYTINYSRKVKTPLPFEMMEIGLFHEFDSASVPPENAFDQVRNVVEGWIEEELKRLEEEAKKIRGS